jgi:hypothetical protein
MTRIHNNVPPEKPTPAEPRYIRDDGPALLCLPLFMIVLAEIMYFLLG